MALIMDTLKAALLPLRRAGGRFFIPPPHPLPLVAQDTIFWKAAQIIGGELVRGDYLEFEVWRGGTFIEAFRTIEAAYLRRCSLEFHSLEYRERASRIWGNCLA